MKLVITGSRDITEFEEKILECTTIISIGNIYGINWWIFK